MVLGSGSVGEIYVQGDSLEYGCAEYGRCTHADRQVFVDLGSDALASTQFAIDVDHTAMHFAAQATQEAGNAGFIETSHCEWN